MNNYKNCELIVIFDGCTDKSEALVKSFFQTNDHSYDVQYLNADNIFEVRSNNLGLTRATGDIACIIQDDNYLIDPFILHELAYFYSKNHRCAVLGGLAGVNYYPIGTKPEGKGQISVTDREVYWRQDAATDEKLTNCFFEVDAVMRGPFCISMSFAATHGTFDEFYAPLYNDDIDLCFRARDRGWTVWAFLGKVENRSLTMANYTPEKWQKFEPIFERNSKEFYRRWNPSTKKFSLRIERIPLNSRSQQRTPLKLLIKDFFDYKFELYLKKSLRKILLKHLNNFPVARNTLLALRRFIKGEQNLKT